MSCATSPLNWDLNYDIPFQSIHLVVLPGHQQSEVKEPLPYPKPLKSRKRLPNKPLRLVLTCFGQQELRPPEASAPRDSRTAWDGIPAGANIRKEVGVFAGQQIRTCVGGGSAGGHSDQHRSAKV